MAKRTKKELEAEAFRARIMELRGLWDTDWNDWEADWLDSEARRPAHYIFSDKERVVLNRLIASSRTFTHYNCWTVQEMRAIASRFVKDLDEDDEEFVERLVARGATVLRVRQINRFASICRLFESLGRDEDVDAVMREVRRNDNEIEYGEGFRNLPAPP